MIYLDSAATSFLKPESVPKAVYDSFSRLGNAGRGSHQPTLESSRLLFRTRRKVARLFGLKEERNIAFMPNVTFALNTVIEGLLIPGDHVITTACEHNSVLRPLYRKEKEGLELSIVAPDSKGVIDLLDIKKEIKDNTRAIIVAHASNVTGNVLDLKELSEYTHEKGVLLIVDAAQTAGTLPINMEEMGIDILCFTGHKGLLGPQGTGGICIKDDIDIHPVVVGGSGVHSFDHDHPGTMPEALEAGTLNGHGIAGLEAGIDYLLERGISSIHKKEINLMKHFLEGIRDIEDIRLYGDYDNSTRAAIVTLNIGNMDAAYVSDILWEDYEICVRAGAHCAPLIHEHFKTVDQGAVRFSFSSFNEIEEVDEAIRAVREIAGEYEESKNA